MKRLAIAVALLLATLSSHAQSHPHPDYERVLVPVFFFGGGAHGAQWWTDLNLLSVGDEFELAHPLLQGDPTCDAFCGCDEKKLVRPFNAELVCPKFEYHSGLILHVPRSVDRDEVAIQARGRDRSRDAERYGSEIPVVWERDLLGNPMLLLDIPTDKRYRTTLRLYDAYQYTTEFTIRVFDMKSLRGTGLLFPLLVTRIQAQYDPSKDIQSALRLRPAFAVIGDLVAAYPQLAQAESIAIEITGSDLLISPPQPSKRFYAIASISNNTTQELTIVSPR